VVVAIAKKGVFGALGGNTSGDEGRRGVDGG